MKLRQADLRAFLEEKVSLYNRSGFIQEDPISIPHQFSRKEDIELIAFLVAVIAWGNRKSIIRSGQRMVELMDGAPYEFISGFSPKDLSRFDNFVHRTFQPYDIRFFLQRLQVLVNENGSLESTFQYDTVSAGIQKFRQTFFAEEHEKRVEKHLPDISRGSAAKRLNMFLRWMVRKDNRGVDFGIWTVFSPGELFLPLDVHTANVSRKLGLLQRKVNDWQAVEEVTRQLRKLDPTDPIKFDFALFSLGAVEQF